MQLFTGAIVALLIVKLQLAGIELIRPIMKKPRSGLRFSLVENKSQIFKRFLINAEKLFIQNNFICNFV